MYRHCLLLLMLAPLFACGCGTPQQKLENFVRSEKKNLPKRIDPNTTLVDLEANDGEIVYVYKINGVGDDAARGLSGTVERQARDQVALNRTKMSDLINAKILMTYVYQNKSGTELFRFSLKPWEI